VRLPSVDEPWFDLQVFRWKNLYAHTIKKPGSIRRHIRRLISPIIEVVVAEKPDVGHKDSRVHVDPIQYVEVISTVCFRYVAVRIGEVPLAMSGAGVIPRCGHGIHAEL